ncbi:MAG: hypothetical protein ABUL64_03955 [Singulisphaera sp.]
MSTWEGPDTAAFCITFWYLPLDYRGSILILNRDTGEQYTYQLTTEKIARIGPGKTSPSA